MIIKNTADVVSYSHDILYKLEEKSKAAFRELHDVIPTLLFLERYLTLMEESKRSKNVYGKFLNDKSIDILRENFMIWKEQAETELGFLDEILQMEGQPE